jgi:hypothetical protein
VLLSLLLTNSGKSASSSRGLLVVANQKEHTIDPDGRRELSKIVVDVNGHEVTVSKDSRFAYVPIYGNSGVGKPGTDGTTIDVIDLQQHKITSTIELGKPLRAHLAEFGPDGLLYVTAELANASPRSAHLDAAALHQPDSRCRWHCLGRSGLVFRIGDHRQLTRFKKSSSDATLL